MSRPDLPTIASADANGAQRVGLARRWRMAALLVTVALGVAVGLLIHLVWHHDAGFLAIPGLLAMVWLFVADPTRCDGNDPEPPS